MTDVARPELAGPYFEGTTMIKLRATRTLSGDYGSVRRDETFETTASNAKSLIRRGYAEPAGGAKRQRPKAKSQAGD